MKELFEEYPYLEDDVIIIRKLSAEDADSLKQLTLQDRVYRYLPTFLYELKYEDKQEVIEKLNEECFDNKESIIMGVFLKEEPEKLIGLAEIYSYKPWKNKASIGYRLKEEYWGQGLATRIAALLKRYILEDVGLRTITGHVMKENIASAKVLMKNGFINKYPDNYEDWGFGQPVLVDKYVFKKV